jgi:hypothetical protein
MSGLGLPENRLLVTSSRASSEYGVGSRDQAGPSVPQGFVGRQGLGASTVEPQAWGSSSGGLRWGLRLISCGMSGGFSS